MTDQNVTVNLTVSSSVVDRAGFGEPMLAAVHTEWPETVRQFATLDEIVEAASSGAAVANHPLYKMASAVFSQNPKPPTLKIGKRPAPAAGMNGRLTPTDTTEGLVVSANVVSPDGTVTAITHTNGASETVAAIVTSLQGQLTAISGITATDDTTHVSWDADTAGEIFFFRNFTGGLEILHESVAGTIAADLAAILTEDDNWYGLAVDGFSGAELDAAATWAESNKKLLACSVQDHSAYDGASTGDAAYLLNQTSRSYAYSQYGANAEQFGALALMGVMFPKDSGDATWAFKNLANVTADTLTTGQKNALLAKRCNIYTDRGGQDKTFEGLTLNSTIPFIDQRRGMDELVARIQEDLTALLNAQEKINYTDAGITSIDAAVRATLNGFTVPRRNFLSSFTTTVPKAADVAAATKSSRRLTMSFTAEGAGAIHGITVNGTIVL